MDKIIKAYAMSDAKISFVSLVNKAANKKQFIITKAEDGTASFQTYGKILKADPESHYVFGIVYEPMTEDTQGNYMTEEEIAKAAYWFAENQGSVDLQHSFEALEGATVVESYIAKCDEEIEGQAIKKGTWLMTVKLTDPDVFEQIQKGELTGFSMGGVGTYSEEDVDISKSEGAQETVEPETAEKEGILRKLAKWIGIPDKIEKGEVKDRFNRGYISENFRDAWWALNDCLLDVWHPDTSTWGPETDMTKVQEALQDFCDIATDLFSHSGQDSIFKCAEGEEMPPIVKAGKAMSKKNFETLKSIHDNLGSFISNFEESEELDVTNEELKDVVKAAVAEAMTKTESPEPVEKQEAPVENPQGETVTKADIQKMIDEAIRKAVTEGVEVEEETPEEDPLEDKVAKAVAKAMEPYLKQEGLPTNLDDLSGIHKSEDQHYLAGIL